MYDYIYAKRVKKPGIHLAHVMHNITMSDHLSFAVTLASSTLKDAYTHALVFEEPFGDIPEHTVNILMSKGLHLERVDCITPATLADAGYCGAILYNIVDRPNLGSALPTMYYSCGVYDALTRPALTVAPSFYASKHNCRGEVYIDEPDCIIPPFIDTRRSRNLKTEDHTFTVTLLHDNYMDSYPCELLIHLLGNLPGDVGLLLNCYTKYKHPGVILALSKRNHRFRDNLRTVATIPETTLGYLLASDVLVYGSAPRYYEPFGRNVMEALALGKAVVCDNKGACSEYLEHGVNCLIYETFDDVLEYISLLKHEPNKRELLGKNAQLTAARYDVNVHAGDFRYALKRVGI